MASSLKQTPAAPVSPLFTGVDNALIIQLGDIGDVVLSLPCFRAVKETYPPARVHAAVWEKAADILADSPWVDAVIAVRRPAGGPLERLGAHLAFVRDLRRRHIDLAVDLRTGTRGAIMARLTGAARRVGFPSADEPFWRDRSFTHLAAPPQAPGSHQVDFNQSLLAAFGIRTRHRWPEITPTARRRDVVAAALAEAGVASDAPMVVVQPFSLWPYKEWAADRYVDLMRRMVRDHRVQVVVSGSPDERARAGDLVTRCGDGVFNLAGRTSLGEYGALLARAAVFIGVDSAGMHIAAAVGTPTVLIFGPSSDADWAPRGPIHRVVRAGMPCEPCHRKGCDGSGRSRCLAALEVPAVYGAVAAALAERRRA